MMNKYLLGSILVLLGSTGLAQAQIELGTPLIPENNLESGSSSYAPALYPADYRSNCKPKPSHPILGHVTRTVLTPIRAAVGHLMPPRGDEAPSKEEVARMIADGGYSLAEITAAKIRIDEAQGSARRAAVKYLATIDCHYYPEAESGLIAAMRADRVETVRYEAALALGNCRGLSEKMLEALNMTALGLELDGNPAESSERVRGAARSSLHRCSSRGLCLPPMEPPAAASVDWPGPDPWTIQPTGYYVPNHVPIAAPIPQHERDLAESISASPKNQTTWTGPRSLYHFLLSFTSGRESTHDTRPNVDPRLRGLTPLGSETMLSIPTMRP